jgi:hypothetical protein
MSPTSGASDAPQIGVPYEFDLLTHCGIDEARFAGVYWEAVEPLGVGGNPPAGWHDPTQHGTMTLLSATEAVFHDEAGHTVKFRVRPGASSFKHQCM